MRARTLGHQREAADRLGVSRGMLSDLEQGRGGTHLQLALRVLADLGLDVVLVPRDARVSLRAKGA
jgi:transcriptional regulator with XRE-family HTH domain